MSPQEFIRKWQPVLAAPRVRKPSPIARIIKDDLVWEARRADQPWTDEEIKEVMRALGLQPGYD